MSEEYISWDSSFELGIPLIDEQHKKLLEICNQLQEAIIKNRKGEITKVDTALETSLRKCIDYTKLHFKTEEVLMEKAEYPEFEEHKSRHRDFEKKILETAKSFGASNLTHSTQIVRFIYDWIVTHIAHEDKLFVKSLAKLSQKK